ncbi:MAG: hypothetical protein DSM106950_23695 [Stigonema ocellatum SAG 48.90 = DSM 106950]|nr:hypothetical protein [Stigonema ocellatum SAG 48.90 = DSM 106950]
MRLERVKELKERASKQVVEKLIRPYSSSPYRNETLPVFPSLGIHLSDKRDYKLAVHIRDESDIDLIQPVLDTVPQGEVDIRITGSVVPQSFGKQDHRRPLCVGVSISHFDPLAQTGTLGCFVRKCGQSELLILSNSHVLANINQAKIGDAIIQPAREDEGKEDTDQIGCLKEFVPLKHKENNFVDAALATVNNNYVENPSQLSNNISLRGFYDEQELNNAMDDCREFVVSKVGRTTGVTWGKVIASEMDCIPLNYSNDLKGCIFNNIIAIEGNGDKAFSRRGDSGSIIVNQDGYAVALLFAGTEIGGRNKCGLTYAIPIYKVLKELDIELVLI